MMKYRIVQRWNWFFFEPIDPLPIALFRIGFGICAFITFLLLHSEWNDWFGIHSWISQRSMNIVEPQARLNLFSIIPQNDFWISALFWISIGACVLLTIGLFSRISSVVVYLSLVSIHWRNPFITNGGDDFLRVAGFFLVFSQAGAALSLDRLFRGQRTRSVAVIKDSSPWAQRMIQLELAFVYFMAFFNKVRGQTWRSGTAVFYVLHYPPLARFALPHWALSSTAVQAETWSVLLFQLSFPFLVWFRRFRYPMLLLGLCFHFCLEYSLNVPLFQEDVLIAYVLFLDAETIRRWAAFFKHVTLKAVNARTQG
jgi:uncharacterized membrane protein YphA (DoxX/SURF4 family)